MQQKQGIDFESGQDQEVINVDFDIVDANPNLEFNIRSFLKNSFDYQTFELEISKLASIIANQQELGDFVVTDQVNLFGFLTIVQLSQIPSIERFLKKVPESIQQKIQEIGLDKFGFLLNERVINLPLELVPTLHKQLIEDIKWVESELKLPIVWQKLLVISKGIKAVQSSKAKLEDYLFCNYEEFQLLQSSEIVEQFGTKYSEVHESEVTYFASIVDLKKYLEFVQTFNQKPQSFQHRIYTSLNNPIKLKRNILNISKCNQIYLTNNTYCSTHQ